MKKFLLLSALVMLLLSLNVVTAGAQSADLQSDKAPIFDHFLENNKVVIDDAVWQMTEHAALLDAYETPLQPSDFQEGDRIGMMINEKGEIEMIWKVK